MFVRALMIAAVVGACAHAPSLPIPPRPQEAPLDASFFGERDTTKPNMRIHLIDVGQGAATLIEFSCGAILIDTGGESDHYMDSTQNLVTYLRAFFETRPDLDNTLALVVLTHPHIDHTRGAPVIFGEFTVQHLVTDGHVGSSGGRMQVQAIHAAHRMHIPDEAITTSAIPRDGLRDDIIDPIACSDGDPDIRAMWGAVSPTPFDWDRKDIENENNQSVVIKVTLGAASLLITGDLERSDALLDKYKGTHALDVDVYEVGHHGSYNATSAALLSALTPKMALIACGPYDLKSTWTAWAYGHPRAVTIDRLQSALASAPPRTPPIIAPVAAATKTFDGRQIKEPIYATAWDGDVIVTMYADGQRTVKTRVPHS